MRITSHSWISTQRKRLAQIAFGAVVATTCIAIGYMKFSKARRGDLWTAIQQSDIEAVERYSAYGGDLNDRHHTLAATPLVYAMRCDQEVVFNRLLRLGANPNQRILTKQGWTTVIHQLSGNPEAKWLLAAIKHGGSISALDSNTYSLLDSSMRHNAFDNIILLLKSGLSPCISQPKADPSETFLGLLRYRTPNIWRDTRNQSASQEVFRILLDNGIDPDFAKWVDDRWIPEKVEKIWSDVLAQDIEEINDYFLHNGDREAGYPHKKTLLHYSLLMNKKESFKTLLSAGLSPNVDLDRPGIDSNVMRSAARHIDAEWILLALSSGGDPNLNDECFKRTNSTILMQAVFSSPAHIRYLCDHGAEVNSVDSQGRTALGIACAAGRFDIVDELINHGADPNPRCIHRNARPELSFIGVIKMEYPLPGVRYDERQKMLREKVIKALNSSGMDISSAVWDGCLWRFGPG